MEDRKVPCVDCICFPICRNQQITTLCDKCSILAEYSGWYNPTGDYWYSLYLKIQGVLTK